MGLRCWGGWCGCGMEGRAPVGPGPKGCEAKWGRGVGRGGAGGSMMMSSSSSPQSRNGRETREADFEDVVGGGAEAPLPPGRRVGGGTVRRPSSALSALPRCTRLVPDDAELTMVLDRWGRDVGGGPGGSGKDSGPDGLRDDDGPTPACAAMPEEIDQVEMGISGRASRPGNSARVLGVRRAASLCDVEFMNGADGVFRVRRISCCSSSSRAASARLMGAFQARRSGFPSEERQELADGARLWMGEGGGLWVLEDEYW